MPSGAARREGAAERLLRFAVPLRVEEDASHPPHGKDQLRSILLVATVVLREGREEVQAGPVRGRGRAVSAS